MLYDNAQLARVYLHAWQVTDNAFFRAIAEEILDYVMREMTDPDGGFYSTQDADSEGREGKFFVWRPGEIREVLGDETEAFMAAYGVTSQGNASTGSAHGFEGKNIQALAQIQSLTAQYPLGFGQWLQALSYALLQPREIAIIGDPEAADTQALLNVVREGYRPFQVVALGSLDAGSPSVPLLQDRGQLDGQATAYVCRDFACQAPITEQEVLEVQLEHR